MNVLMAVLGVALCALPFVALAALLVRDVGWRETLTAFGVTAAVIATVGVGVLLMTQGGLI